MKRAARFLCFPLWDIARQSPKQTRKAPHKSISDIAGMNRVVLLIWLLSMILLVQWLHGWEEHDISDGM